MPEGQGHPAQPSEPIPSGRKPRRAPDYRPGSAGEVVLAKVWGAGGLGTPMLISVGALDPLSACCLATCTGAEGGAK